MNTKRIKKSYLSFSRASVFATVLLVMFLCQFGLSDAKSAETEIKIGTRSGKGAGETFSVNQPKQYCSENEPCPSYMGGCDFSTNTCKEKCYYNEYWNGIYCEYCGYGFSWDYDTLTCHDDNKEWIIWTIVGVSLGLTVIVALTIAISCVRCAMCPLYRRRARQAAARTVIVAQPNTAYGVPAHYPPNQVVYAVQTQGQFIPPPQYQQQQLQQQPPIELLPMNTATNTNTNLPTAAPEIKETSVTEDTNVYPSLNP